jgi:hypothetical protein
LSPTHALRNGLKNHAGLEVRLAGVPVAPVALGFGFPAAGVLRNEQRASIPRTGLDDQPRATGEMVRAHRLLLPGKAQKGNKGGARLCAFSVAPVVDLVDFGCRPRGASGRSVI